MAGGHREVYTVEDTDLNGLTCLVCMFVLRDAIQTEEGHRLCETCCKEVQNGKDCGVSVSRNEQIFPDRAVRRDVLNLLVKCRFHMFGCTWQSKLQHLDEHTVACRYKPVPCSNRGCSEQLSADALDKHLALECEYRLVTCEYCDHQCLAKELQEHYSVCCNFPIKCEICTKKFQRQKCDEHRALQCTKIECVGCRELLLNSDTPDKEAANNLPTVAKHLLSNVDIFNHFQKLGVLVNENKILLNFLRSSHSKGSDSVPKYVERTLDMLTGKMNALETSVETLTSTRHSDKNSESKAKAMELTLKQQGDRILALEEIISTLQNQAKEQNKVISTLQIQQTGRSSRQYENKSSDTSNSTRIIFLEKKLEDTERKVSSLQVHVSEIELQLQASLASTHNGAFLWRIPDISRRKRDAIEERITSIYSPPFYTGRNGYKMCARAYLNGDGMGYKTHISLFFVLMKGEFDPLLKWPFDYKVSLILVDQNHKKHIVQTFKPTPDSSSFQRPVSDMNVASGCPQFAKLNVFDDDSYIKDDVMFIKCIVDTSKIFHP